MKRILLLLSAVLCCGVLVQCSEMAQQRMVSNSRVVVLDIGHYYAEGRGGQGARTPDATQGANIEECEFWYRYARYVKEEVQKAGYTCIVCNRGALPADPDLARSAKETGVVQVNSPSPTAVYRSQQHPMRMAVGMMSVNYALSCKPAAVVFLHHNSDSDTWRVSNKSAFYCNESGIELAAIMAKIMNRTVVNHAMPNNGVPCGVVVRTDGRRGGGDWLNACDDSYVPAAITEVAFLSNPEHARFLARRENAELFARAIGQGIVAYLRQR